MPITYEIEKTGRVITWKREHIDFPPHFHDTVELCAIINGSCTACVDFNEYKLRAGDIFIAFGGQIHSYSDQSDILCFTFLFPSDICPPLSHDLTAKLPLDPVIRKNERSAELFMLLEKIMQYNGREEFYSKQILRGYFSVLLGELLSSMVLIDAPTKNPSTERRIINYCTENFRSPLTLEKLSEELYISRHHISHLFSSKLKVGFNEFINQLRIRDACARLEAGESVTEAAFGSGFSSIRTFNRAFLKDIGINPSEYIKKLQAK